MSSLTCESALHAGNATRGCPWAARRLWTLEWYANPCVRVPCTSSGARRVSSMPCNRTEVSTLQYVTVHVIDSQSRQCDVYPEVAGSDQKRQIARELVRSRYPIALTHTNSHGFMSSVATSISRDRDPKATRPRAAAVELTGHCGFLEEPSARSTAQPLHAWSRPLPARALLSEAKCDPRRKNGGCIRSTPRPWP
jgi:hypothetical protein